MGLLSSVKEPVLQVSPQSAKPSGGLLARASNVLKDPSNFQQWAELNHFEHTGIFSKLDKVYVLTHAYGLDAASIAGSISTADFWNGSLPRSLQWIGYNSTDNRFSGFMQFISPSLQSHIQSFHFLRVYNTEDSPIIMVVQTSDALRIPTADAAFLGKLSVLLSVFDREQKPDIASFTSSSHFGLQISQAKLFLLCIKLAIESSVSPAHIESDTVREQIEKTIFELIFFYIKQAFQFPNECCQGSNDEIKIALFSRSSISEKLIQNQLIQVLKPVLGDAAQSILLLPAGYCNKMKSIQDFLIQG